MSDRLACRAVFLDAGGVLVLRDRHLLAHALARAGIHIDPDAVPAPTTAPSVLCAVLWRHLAPPPCA